MIHSLIELLTSELSIKYCPDFQFPLYRIYSLYQIYIIYFFSIRTNICETKFAWPNVSGMVRTKEQRGSPLNPLTRLRNRKIIKVRIVPEPEQATLSFFVLEKLTVQNTESLNFVHIGLAATRSTQLFLSPFLTTFSYLINASFSYVATGPCQSLLWKNIGHTWTQDWI